MYIVAPDAAGEEPKPAGLLLLLLLACCIAGEADPVCEGLPAGEVLVGEGEVDGIELDAVLLPAGTPSELAPSVCKGHSTASSMLYSAGQAVMLRHKATVSLPVKPSWRHRA
jgi:hypothetical protein